MYLSKYQTELNFCVAQASALLGGPARPVRLEWELEKSLQRRLVLQERRGLGAEPAVLFLDRSKRGHRLDIGIERYRWETPEGAVEVVRVSLPCGEHPVQDFWAVREDEFRRFYRLLRRHVRRVECESPPILDGLEQRRLWDNTVGLLRRGSEALVRYGVVPKRGVLLLGAPGNGKTMACRWLAAECRTAGLEWKSVTAEMYEDARIDRTIPSLFRLDSPGIILFDDFDAALRDRHVAGETDKHATFLAELDGVVQKTGVVYLFTSNARLEELDPAMRRPGRIDVIVHFANPGAELRRRLIVERWHPELVAGVDVESLVAQTDGYSFAELEEVRKQLVMRRVSSGRWDWPSVRREMEHRDTAGTARPIGFRHATQTAEGNGHVRRPR